MDTTPNRTYRWDTYDVQDALYNIQDALYDIQDDMLVKKIAENVKKIEVNFLSFSALINFDLTSIASSAMPLQCHIEVPIGPTPEVSIL